MILAAVPWNSSGHCSTTETEEMKSKFELDGVRGVPVSATIDPEAFDASEQQFAASLEQNLRRPRTFSLVLDAELKISTRPSLLRRS